MSWKATKPKAVGGLCWVCDKRLYAGARSYATMVIDGMERPVHLFCKKHGRATR